MNEILRQAVSELKSPSDWQEKIWGYTREVVNSPYFSRHELKLVAGGYCSLHYHETRSNNFHVTSGKVEIIQMYGPVVKRNFLTAGESQCIPSLVPHMFVVYEDGTMIEEYYSDRGMVIVLDDIIRIVAGGKLDVCMLNRLPSIIIDGLSF